MDKLTKLHHSLVDWVFQDIPNFKITDRHFISPPTSLGLDPNGGWKIGGWVFLNDVLGKCIPYGMIINNFYNEDQNFIDLWFYFRAQGYSANDWPTNCYFIHTSKDKYSLYKVVDNLPALLTEGNLIPALPANAWSKHRISFFDWIDASLHHNLRIVYAIDRGAGYATIFTHDDNAPSWSDSALNRIGFMFTCGNFTKWAYTDDTEIWGAP